MKRTILFLLAVMVGLAAGCQSAKVAPGTGHAASAGERPLPAPTTVSPPVKIATEIYTWTTFAGEHGVSGSTDGGRNVARFNEPIGIAVDSADHVYVADSGNHTIRKITPEGMVTTLAGSAKERGSADGTGSAARFAFPCGIDLDREDNLYVADSDNYTVRQVSPSGVVTTLAGSAGLKGGTDGVGSAARFNHLAGVALDSAGNVYVADASNHTIRKVSPAGAVTTLAGSTKKMGVADGTGEAARFSCPYGVALDPEGNVFVTDGGNGRIRLISAGGVVTTLAGSPGQFMCPYGVALDSGGNLFVTDVRGRMIRKVTPAGVVTTVGSSTVFEEPEGIAVDSAGNLYVADAWTHCIFKGTPSKR